jgi:hypothetical protein
MERLACVVTAIATLFVLFCAAGSSQAAGSDQERLPGELFRDCSDCPELVVAPSGEFDIGSTAKRSEQPVHHVSIGKNFAIGRRDVTFAEWDRCVAQSGCKFSPPDQGWERGDRPVTNVSWDDAKEFIAWLSKTTGKSYRLPTEAECKRRSNNPSLKRPDFPAAPEQKSGSRYPFALGRQRVGDEGRGALWARSLRGSDRGIEPSRGGATVWNRPSHGRQDGEVHGAAGLRAYKAAGQTEA